VSNYLQITALCKFILNYYKGIVIEVTTVEIFLHKCGLDFPNN
jgi:hypothetical protein